MKRDEWSKYKKEHEKIKDFVQALPVPSNKNMGKGDKGMKYTIVKDDDGHYYVIPKDRRDVWAGLAPSDPVPEWADRIDGPSSISFDDYRY